MGDGNKHSTDCTREMYLALEVNNGLALKLSLDSKEGLRDGLLGVAQTAQQRHTGSEATDHDECSSAAHGAAILLARAAKGRAGCNRLPTHVHKHKPSKPDQSASH